MCNLGGMPKLKIEDFLKLGCTLERLPIIDYNSPEMKERLHELKKKSEQCLKNKNVNWTRLANIYMTI